MIDSVTDTSNEPNVGAQDLVLIRHGQTEWSTVRKHTGRSDVPLTTEGRDQAESLRNMLHQFPFTAVFTSPLSRARDTMKLAGYAGTVLDDLAEWDYGEYEGRRTEDIRREIPGWSVWTHPIRGGESLAEVADRADRVIARALSVEGPIALFGHAHLFRVLGARWIGLPPAGGRLLTLDTATVSVLGWEREQRVIRVWNMAGDPSPLDQTP
jgi:probable phosphoglycerate mutase